MDSPVNATEKEIAEMFCIPIRQLKNLRRGNNFSKDICFTMPESMKVIYCVEEFKKWLDQNKIEAHKDFNQRIRESVARFHR